MCVDVELIGYVFLLMLILYGIREDFFVSNFYVDRRIKKVEIVDIN